MSLPLANKVAIVTGSSRSIGAALAIRLAHDGASVVINYVSNSHAAQEVVSTIEKEGNGKAVAIATDICTAQGRQSLVDQTVQKWGKIDILINNAGVMKLKTLDVLDEANFDEHFLLNVKAPLFMTKAVLPHMPPGGRVLFVSSSLTHASTITPNYVVYAASKAAVEQFTRTLAKDLAHLGINVNTFSPGPTDTPLFREGKSESLMNWFANLSPFGRLGTSEDIQGVVSFLVGPDSKWVSGQNIRVNGGFAV